MSGQDLCPFLIELFAYLLLNCMSSLCILDINSLLELLFSNTISNSVGCLFVLSFCYRSLLLCRSFLVYFCHYFLAFWVKLIKCSLRPRSINLVSIFSSMKFIVSDLLFKSLTHFELIFLIYFLLLLNYSCMPFLPFPPPPPPSPPILSMCPL